MHPRLRNLLLLIGVGGTTVLASYVPAFVGNSGLAEALWGGVPQGLRAYYGPNMLLAAASFFPATWALAWATPPDRFEALTGHAHRFLLIAYGLILFPSAAWLPLTARYLEAPSTALWWTIRLDLLLVAVGASAIWYLLVRRARHGPALLWGAVALFTFFWIQTAVLDALIWPAYYPR